MSRKLRIVKIECMKNSAKVADQCLIAEKFFDRFKGLIGKKSMNSGEGLLLKPCNDIHMWFMSIPIDVVFLKKDRKQGHTSSYYRVTSVRENLKPWKFFPVGDLHASETLELPVGTIQRCELKVGDELCIN